MWSVDCAVCSVQGAVCIWYLLLVSWPSVRREVHSVECRVCNVQYAVYVQLVSAASQLVECAVCSVWSVECAVFTEHCSGCSWYLLLVSWWSVARTNERPLGSH